MRRLGVVAAVVALTGCGGEDTTSAAALRSCVDKRLPPGAVDRVTESEEAGVTTLVYVHGDSETVVSVFPSEGEAQDAIEAEERLGDAHDKRARNVLYSGGGAAEDAVAACLQ